MNAKDKLNQTIDTVNTTLRDEYLKGAIRCLQETTKVDNETQKLPRLQEMAYLIHEKHQLPFLIEVRSKENAHAKSYPHCHVYPSDRKYVYSMFITEETPKSISDLRYDKATVKKGKPDSSIEKALVEWANKRYSTSEFEGNNWDRLKEFYEGFHVTDGRPTYPSISVLNQAPC